MLSAMVDDLLGHNRNEDGSSELHWSDDKVYFYSPLHSWLIITLLTSYRCVSTFYVGSVHTIFSLIQRQTWVSCTSLLCDIQDVLLSDILRSL